jgi:hypothetical protein
MDMTGIYIAGKTKSRDSKQPRSRVINSFDSLANMIQRVVSFRCLLHLRLQQSNPFGGFASEDRVVSSLVRISRLKQGSLIRLMID